MYFITHSKIIYSFLKKRNLSYIIANLFYQNKNVMMDLHDLNALKSSNPDFNE